jgi:hypothetical protein
MRGHATHHHAIGRITARLTGNGRTTAERWLHQGTPLDPNGVMNPEC